MSTPNRNSQPDAIPSLVRCYFVTTKASTGRNLLQSEQNALLLVDVLRSLVAKRKFRLHDFVIMPDHFHLLITVESGMTLGKAMQLIKRRFSHRLTKEFGYLGEVWQHGFSKVLVTNKESFIWHRSYIAMNPVKAGLAGSDGIYPFCFEFLAKKKLAGAEAPSRQVTLAARLKSCPVTKLKLSRVSKKLAARQPNAANLA